MRRVLWLRVSLLLESINRGSVFWDQLNVEAHEVKYHDSKNTYCYKPIHYTWWGTWLIGEPLAPGIVCPYGTISLGLGSTRLAQSPKINKLWCWCRRETTWRTSYFGSQRNSRSTGNDGPYWVHNDDIYLYISFIRWAVMTTIRFENVTNETIPSLLGFAIIHECSVIKGHLWSSWVWYILCQDRSI